MAIAELTPTLQKRFPKERLEYWRLLLTTALLALVFPLVVLRLISAPIESAEKALGGAVQR